MRTGTPRETFCEEHWGAEFTREQLDCFLPMGSHTSRYAATCALFYEHTGDETYKALAYRAFNMASYWAKENGVIHTFARIIQDNGEIVQDFAETDIEIWFTDGYADYIRHFMTGMGVIHEWAPPDEDHLLRSTSIVTDIKYGNERISYRTFDAAATETLRLTFTPAKVTAGGRILKQRSNLEQEGWTFDGDLDVLRIRHDGAKEIELGS